MRWLRHVLVTVVLLLGGGAGLWFATQPPSAPKKPQSDATPKNCDFLAPSEVKVRCYWVAVGEPGARVSLSVAVIRGSGAAGSQPPLVYLAGGPGQGHNTAPTMLSVWTRWYQKLGLQRDFILMDLRGLRRSEPSWDCDSYLQAAKRLWQLDLNFAEEAARSIPLLEECYQRFEDFLRQHTPAAGVEQFTSRQNAADVGQALDALGYVQWDLLGVSYGTRVALIAALSQPQVRRLILDSPYPIAYGQLSDTPLLWAQAFTRFFAACDEGLWGCPVGIDSEALFWQVLEGLDAQPLTATVEDWSTDTPQSWVVNGERFAAVVYSAFYSRELYFLVHPALHALSEGNAEPAQLLLEYFYNQAFDPEFNNVVFWATECNDNTPESEADYLASLSQVGRWASLFDGDWHSDICRYGAFATGQKPPMAELDIPVLLAVGQWDPITPISHGQALLRWLPRGLYLPLAENAHAEFYSSDCAASVVPWFLSASDDELRSQWRERASECE